MAFWLCFFFFVVIVMITVCINYTVPKCHFGRPKIHEARNNPQYGHGHVKGQIVLARTRTRDARTRQPRRVAAPVSITNYA
jgi:hypothetical protein